MPWTRRPPMDELRAAFGGRCAWCGYKPRLLKHRLHFAHVAPTALRGRGRGQWDRYCDIRRNPERYVLLCDSRSRCHRRFDRLDPGARKAAEAAFRAIRPAPPQLAPVPF